MNETEFRSVSISEICDALTKKRNALILAHVNPDGDAVGSAFALKAIVLAMGGQARVVCANEPAGRLRFLYLEQEDCVYRDDVENYDLIFSVDVASPAQLGELESLIPHMDFMIDHHGMGEPFAPEYVDEKAAAAGEIVFSIYRELKNRGCLPTVPDIARRIYAAVVSDTGSFKFSNTTPYTHRIAAELVSEINNAGDKKEDAAAVCRSLFGQRTLKELTAQALAIQNLRFYSNGELGAVLFTQKMLEDAGLTEDEIGNIVDVPRSVEGTLIGVSLKQSSSDPCVYKVSSRANADCDVAAVCASFGGGGHVRAAGCSVTAASPEEALELVSSAFLDAVELYKSRITR